MHVSRQERTRVFHSLILIFELSRNKRSTLFRNECTLLRKHETDSMLPKLQTTNVQFYVVAVVYCRYENLFTIATKKA